MWTFSGFFSPLRLWTEYLWVVDQTRHFKRCYLGLWETVINIFDYFMAQTNLLNIKEMIDRSSDEEKKHWLQPNKKFLRNKWCAKTTCQTFYGIMGNTSAPTLADADEPVIHLIYHCFMGEIVQKSPNSYMFGQEMVNKCWYLSTTALALWTAPITPLYRSVIVYLRL